MNIAPVSMLNMAIKQASFKGPEKAEPIKTEEVLGGKIDYCLCDGKVYTIFHGDENAAKEYEMFKHLRGLDRLPAEEEALNAHHRAKGGTAEEM